MRGDRAFLVLAAVAGPLTLAFCWRSTVSSLGDDSVSYLSLARYFSSLAGDPWVGPWAKYDAHFPPLFPALLALTGGARNLLVAHLFVGACALAALAAVYAYARERMRGSRAAVLAAVLFLLAPSAWTSIHGILSEPLFLALTLAALTLDARLTGNGGNRGGYIALALLIGAAYLTRAAGIALVSAYAVHMVIRALSRRTLPTGWQLLPFVLPIALSGAWLALRPQPEIDYYRLTLQGVADRWLHDPHVLSSACESYFGGWVALFTANSDVAMSMRVLFGLVGAFGVAGAMLGARRNRLDSWYVLASLAMIFIWVFPEEIMRRLFYPLLPLLLVHAAEALAALCARLDPLRRGQVLAAAWLVTAVMVLPAAILIAQKSFDRAPFAERLGYAPGDITDYYTTVNVRAAREYAGRHAAVLGGLQAIARVTPPDARVMWTRPEYVAVLGHRAASAWYLMWDKTALARGIHETGTGYVVAARLFKNDLAGRTANAFEILVDDTPPYLRPVLAVANPADGKREFFLFEVDRAALDRYVASTR